MQTEPTTSEIKKTSKFDPMTLALILLVLLAIGLGVWGYLLNTNIQTTQAERTALKDKFNAITKEKDSVSDELDTAKLERDGAQADLDKAKADLAVAQEELTKSKDEATKLQEAIDKSLKYLDIALGVYVHGDSLVETEKKVKALNDPKLTEKFNAYKEKDTELNFSSWMNHLFTTMADLIKVE